MKSSITRFTILLTSLIVAALFIPACGAPSPDRSELSMETQVNSPTQTPPPAITMTPGITGKSTAIPAFSADQLKDMRYQLDIIAESLPESDGLVQLTGGVFEQLYPGSATGVRVELRNSALRDLNGDGSEDAVVFLAINTGGTGVFMQLASVINQNGELKRIASTDLGDRIQVKLIQIQDGIIRLETVVHSDTNPLCCPTLEKLQEYILQDNRLVTRER